MRFTNILVAAFLAVILVSSTLSTSVVEVPEVHANSCPSASITIQNDGSMGTLGGATSTANGVNGLNESVGSSETSGGETHAFYHDTTSGISDLNLGDAHSEGTDLNDSGEVVGNTYISSSVFGWYWDTPTGKHPLSDPPGQKKVKSLNNSNPPLLAGIGLDFGEEAVVWTSPSASALLLCPGSECRAHDNDDANRLAGSTLISGVWQGALWDSPSDSSPDILPGLGGNTDVLAREGSFSGGYTTDSGGAKRPAVWEGTAINVLAMPAFAISCEVRGVNTQGLSVGACFDGTDFHTVAWFSGAVEDLGIGVANDTNDNNRVVGQLNGVAHWWDLTLTPGVVDISGTPEEIVAQLLVRSGELGLGNDNPLVAKLEAAQNSLNQGKTKAAIGQLRAFTNQMSALVRTGQVEECEADAQISAAVDAMNQL